MKRLNTTRGEKCREMNDIPNIIYETKRPDNGVGGVLYPIRHLLIIVFLLDYIYGFISNI